jgi:hypothetical protein
MIYYVETFIFSWGGKRENSMHLKEPLREIFGLGFFIDLFFSGARFQRRNNFDFLYLQSS